MDLDALNMVQYSWRRKQIGLGLSYRAFRRKTTLFQKVPSSNSNLSPVVLRKVSRERQTGFGRRAREAAKQAR